MAKMRVHELAKELDIKSADIVKALGEKGIDVKAMSSVDDSEGDMIEAIIEYSNMSEAFDSVLRGTGRKRRNHLSNTHMPSRGD